MLYSVLDTGNFFVIPGSPIDVWAAESYSRTHSRSQLRQDKGYSKEDMLVLVVGSSFFYKELSWDYAVSMHNIGPLLTKYARVEDNGAQFKFIFLCGNSSDGFNDALQVYNNCLACSGFILCNFMQKEDNMVINRKHIELLNNGFLNTFTNIL